MKTLFEAHLGCGGLIEVDTYGVRHCTKCDQPVPKINTYKITPEERLACAIFGVNSVDELTKELQLEG